MSMSERLSGLPLRENVPIALVGLGHGATHWVAASFYLLLPSMSTSLGLDYSATGVLVSVMHIAAFLANFGSGPITDITGRRVLLQVSALLIGAAALALVGLAGGLILLGALVAVIGATNNLWHPPAISYLSGRFSEHKGWALSIHALGANLGDSIAPLVAGLMLISFTWEQSSVMLSLPVVAVAFLLMLGLSSGAARAETSKKPQGLGEYLSSLRDVAKDRDVLGLCIMSAFRSMSQNGLLVFLPLYLANEMKVAPWIMGITVSALQVGGLIASPVAGRISDRVGRRTVVVSGLGVSTVAILVLTCIGNEMLFVAGVSILGFALFAVRPVVHAWIMDITPPSMGGSAVSLLFGSQTLLSILAPTVGGMIADEWGLTATFYALAASMALTNLLAMRLRDKKDG